MNMHTGNDLHVIYYTHPACPDSWAMQSAWQRFNDDFGGLFRLQVCMTAAPATDLGQQGRNSSQNAALAVKAASLQSTKAAQVFLNALREASINQHLDISKLQTLVDIARQVNRVHDRLLDLNRFGKDISSFASRKALEQDRHKAAVNHIVCSPTITMTVAGKGRKISGVTSYANLAIMLQGLILNPCNLALYP